MSEKEKVLQNKLKFYCFNCGEYIEVTLHKGAHIDIAAGTSATSIDLKGVLKCNKCGSVVRGR